MGALQQVLLGYGVGATGPAAYSPAAWYDADDLTTLFQDAAGTVPVVADGDPVGLWRDKSGNSRHFSQTTAGSRPIWHTSGGFSWVEFDGTNDWMIGATSMLAFATVNVFVGARSVAGGVDFATVIGQPHAVTHTNPFYRWSIQTRNTAGLTIGWHANGTAGASADAGAAAGNDFIATFGISSMWRPSISGQAFNILRINKVQALAGGTGTQTITYPNATPSVMGANVVGSGDRFKGRIYSLIVFNAAVTSQTWVDDIENYIDTKVP